MEGEAGITNCSSKRLQHRVAALPEQEFEGLGICCSNSSVNNLGGRDQKQASTQASLGSVCLTCPGVVVAERV